MENGRWKRERRRKRKGLHLPFSNLHSPSSILRSLWDQQQAIARFQEYVRKVDEEGADPTLLFVLAQMM